MTASTPADDRWFEFELDDGAGRGVSSSRLAADHDRVLAVLLRDHYCAQSRKLVRRLAERYEEFAALDIAIVVMLPDIRERALVWHRRYELPFPVVADPGGDAGDGPPDEYDAFEPFQRSLCDRPGAVLFECVDGRLRVDAEHGATPSVDSLLERVDNRDKGTVGPADGVRAD